ncbi:hypothetical protein JXA47_17210 [Candidatus Sumerlaeota bacterium]|nr:hypothetical protein [Candidatus Sumerlaeota bacterium]
MALLSKIGRILREEGLSGVLRRALSRVHRRRDEVFVERNLHRGDEVPFLPRKPFVMRFLESGELDLIAPHVTPERLAQYERRLADGMRCAVCLTPDESECLGWVWSTDRPHFEPFDNATYLAIPDTFLHIDGEVVSESRGRGVAFTAYPLMWSFWRGRGFDKCHCTIDVLNKPSLKIHDRMGYERTATVTVRTLFGFMWARPASHRLAPGDVTGRG